MLERGKNVGEPPRVTSVVEVAQLTPSLAGFVEEIFAVQGDQRDGRFLPSVLI